MESPEEKDNLGRLVIVLDGFGFYLGNESGNAPRESIRRLYDRPYPYWSEILRRI